MKKLLLLLLVPSMLLASCGSEAEGEGETGEESSGISTEGMVEKDFTADGLPLVIMLPVVTSPISGESIPAIIEVQNDFEWHIRIGEEFHLIIEDMGESENHIPNVKDDHGSTTNVWDVNYIVEEEDALFWVQTLPENSGLTDADDNPKGFYHLEVYKNIDGIAYEIYTYDQDEHGKMRGEQMFASAKSIKSNAAS